MDGCPIGPLRLNIFSAAWKGIEDWDNFPCHRDAGGRIDTHQYCPSQVMGMDMFGTLKTRFVRHEVLNVLAERAGCPLSDNRPISPAWLHAEDVLKEGSQRTRVDTVAMSDEAVIFFYLN